MPLSGKWRLVLALVGVVLWSQPGVNAKIEHFTDKEGTVHISNNAAEAEPGKPDWTPSRGRMTPPPQIFPAAPAGPVPQPQIVPPPVEPPEMPGDETDPMADPLAPPAQVAPDQQQ
ncbi:MAG: hypothetical protein NTW80_05305 [Deltaproteobacteria bacterium]|nr:hypothetical protein [Deltaproteobacteria bacterium]